MSVVVNQGVLDNNNRKTISWKGTQHFVYVHDVKMFICIIDKQQQYL